MDRMDDDRNASLHFADDAAPVSEFLDAALAGLGETSPVVLLDERTGRRIAIPAPLAEGFRELAHWMAQGRVASVTPSETWVGVDEAEDELGITPDALERLAAEGLITLDTAGAEPRVNLVEGLRWKERERIRTVPHVEQMFDRAASDEPANED